MASNADPGHMTLSLPQTEMVVAGIIILSCGWCKKKLGPDSTKWTLNLCSDLLLSNKPSHNLQRQKPRTIMVIGLLAIAAIPTVTGVGNAVSAQKRQNESMSKEQEKFHLTYMLRQNGKIEEVGQGVLVDKKVSFYSLPDCHYKTDYPQDVSQPLRRTSSRLQIPRVVFQVPK